MTRLPLSRSARWLMVLLTAVSVAGCAAGAQPRQHTVPAVRARQPGTFLATVVAEPAAYGRSTRPFHLKVIRYQVNALQLRSARTGRVLVTLLRSLGDIDAVRARDGSVIAVVNYGCRAQVLRIDPRTSRSALIRTMPQYASDAALSPDGRRLAYLTYPASAPQPCRPRRQPASPVQVLVNPGGPIQFLPSVVAVADLGSGAVVQAATSSPGNPPSGPAWSPDGKSIAVTDSGTGSVVLLSATQPNFASAPRIRPPHRCGYIDVAWTVRGPVAVLGCNRQHIALSPQTLVQLSASGRRVAAWTLPACIDGVHAMTDATQTSLLIESDVGYGNGAPCGSPPLARWAIQLATAGPSRLKTIAVYPQNTGQFHVTGW
jgi:dipeptidyl aminopeptidase/acylaminoacyl peptidase